MTQKLKTISQSPYYDDFNASKDFVRVLYRPNYPVQARELTTMQTILQEQVSRFGDKIFKDGARISEGDIKLQYDVSRLILTGESNLSFPPTAAQDNATIANISQLAGKIITNAAGDVKARVVSQPSTSTANIGNLYFEYLTTNTFTSTGGFIYAHPSDNPSMVASFYNTYSGLSNSMLASISEGIYYVKGVFCKVASQTVVVDASTNTPSCHIGFTADEEIVTHNDDTTLYDNARGVSNEGAPGAHRLKLSLAFSVRPLSAAADASFYRMKTLIEGAEQDEGVSDNGYKDLIDIMARRTYDESGNYSLKPFSPSLENGNGSTTFQLNISPSKAYVYGFEIEKTNTTKIQLNRGTDTKRLKNYKIPMVGTTALEVSATTGVLPGQSGGNPYTYANRLELRDNGGTAIGVARGYAVQNDVDRGVSKSYLYLYDVRMYQTLTTAAATGLAVGNDIYSGTNKGYIHEISGTSVTLINWNTTFQSNQTISSTVNPAVSTTVSAGTAVAHSLGSVKTVVDAATGTAFTATVTGVVKNSNSMLLKPLSKHISTILENGSAIDNDFDVIEDGGSGAYLSENGSWAPETYNDKQPITKTLKFKYLMINNSASRSSINYGWNASDKEVSLHYPDIFKVYSINQSSNLTTTNGRFARLNISTAGVVPQGAVITGNTSGTKAIVALSNSTTVGAGNLSGVATHHYYEEGTGNNTILEVIYQKGLSFTNDETLTVTSPAGQAAFTNIVTVTSTTAASGNEITGTYNLDNGQRNEYYDVGRLVRKENKPAPTAEKNIIVFFSYFEDDTFSDGFKYYTADSYADLDFYGDDVRFYNEAQAIVPKTDDVGIDLRNAIDFRLKVSTPSASTASSPFIFSNRTFVNTSRVLPNSNFTTDMDILLGRIDIVSLDKDGSFVITSGVAAEKPKKPSSSLTGMDLYVMSIPPAVRYPQKEVNIEVIDNRRYTMRDIGKLDSRITNLEQAVTLSLLESQALHDDIDNRSKMGFVVDDFSTVKSTSTPADRSHQEWNSSIDTIKRTLIPAQTGGAPVPMEISTKTNISDFFENYYIKAFRQELMISQSRSTSAHLINPFATWRYVGNIELDPSEDHWHIREDDYFTSLYGELQPFEGDAAAFANFCKITTTSPGGSSTVRKEWVGEETTKEFQSAGYDVSETYQAQKKITTTRFETPRTVDGAAPTSTLTGTSIVENPQDYWMRSVTVNFTATGLRPSTEHQGLFGGSKVVVTSVTSNSNGEASGSFTIPATTFKAGAETFELKDVSTSGVTSSAVGLFKSVGHLDEFQTVVDVSSSRTSVIETDSVYKTGNKTKIPVVIPPVPVVPPVSPPVSTDVSPDVTTINVEAKQIYSPVGIYSGITLPSIIQTVQIPTSNWKPNVVPTSVGGRLPRHTGRMNGRTVGQVFKIPETTTASGRQPESSIMTSIDLWFGTVDDRTGMNKVRVQIRETINGYPGGEANVLTESKWTYLTSSNAVATPTTENAVNIKFKAPVLLDPSKEYAITIESPSDLTTTYVATIGETLIDGSGIHDSQPNLGNSVGSFFVVHNSSSWQPSPNTDLSFKLYRANFDAGETGSTHTSELLFQNTLSNGSVFNGDVGAFNQGLVVETFANSNYVMIHHPNHGLNFDAAQVTLSGFGSSALNGIPASEINTTHAVYFATLNTYFIRTTTVATSSGRAVSPVFTSFATQCLMYDSILTNLLVRKSENDEVNISIKTAECNSVVHEVQTNKLVNTALTSPIAGSVFTDIQMNALHEFESPQIIRNLLNASSSNDLQIKVTLESGSFYSSPFFKTGQTIEPIVFRNVVGQLLIDSDLESLTTSSVSSGATDDEKQQFASYFAGAQSVKEQSAYVTRQIDIELPADGLTILFDADMEPGSKVIVSYKARATEDDTPFSQIAWEDFSVGQQITEDNYGKFSSDPSKTQYTARLSVPYEFTSFKVRLRMQTTNEAQIPRISDLRIVADY